MNAERIARAYVALLESQLSRDDLIDIRAGVGSPDDYCDGNMVMDAAFKECGIDPLPDLEAGMSDANVALWNEAYGIAMRELRS